MSAEPVRGVTDPELDKLRRLTEIGRALTYTTSLDQVARVTVERGAGLLGAVAAMLMLRKLKPQPGVKGRRPCYIRRA